MFLSCGGIISVCVFGFLFDLTFKEPQESGSEMEVALKKLYSNN